MTRSGEITQAYATNPWLINRLTEGLSQDECLLQPPFPTNCVNWILGQWDLLRSYIISQRESA